MATISGRALDRVKSLQPKDSDPDPADSNPHYDPNSNSDSDLDPRTHGACSEIAEGLVAHNVAVSSGQGVSIQFAVSIISDWTA